MMMMMMMQRVMVMLGCTGVVRCGAAVEERLGELADLGRTERLLESRKGRNVLILYRWCRIYGRIRLFIFSIG
uniref:Putative secreted protein n=1 Tax=Anopheles darlingi TaxID=43151 RepID=A0A2M4DRI7_ANODA